MRRAGPRSAAPVPEGPGSRKARALPLAAALALTAQALAEEVTPESFLQDGATALDTLRGPFLSLVLTLLGITLLGVAAWAVIQALRGGRD